ncbi:MAG: hypothetical protein OHK0039_47610 [Bacteroidia bacterium]
MPATLRLVCLLMCSLSACRPPAEPPLLERLLADGPGVVRQVMADPARYEVQISYVQIDRDSAQVPHFTRHSFRLDSQAYFYPASTVKLPAVLLAFEKLNRLGVAGLSKYSTMLADSAADWQTLAWIDSSAADGLPSIAHYARKILLVSDNDAFNRLYDWVGQAEMNEGLWAKGYTGTRILHRLSVPLTAAQNRCTHPLRFFDRGRLVLRQDMLCNERPIPLPPPVLRGRGVATGDSIRWEPMDFSGKNAFPLAEQQAMLQAVMFPDGRFDLGDDDYRFLYRYLSLLPRESDFPAYDRGRYYDGYAKFFLYGDRRDPIPAHLRIYNKIGAAYGYLTDNAYIVDFEVGVEFLLAATISVNENGIYNDDQYAYETIGLPFLAELGWLIYRHELARTRDHRPDLAALQALSGPAGR